MATKSAEVLPNVAQEAVDTVNANVQKFLTDYKLPSIDAVNANVKKFVEDYKLPTVDTSLVTKNAEKNAEAFKTANDLVLEAYRSIGERQAELVRQNFDSAVANAKVLSELSTDPKALFEKYAEFSKAAFEGKSTNVKELFGLVVKSHEEAAAVVKTRVTESVEEFKAQVKS